MKASPFVVLAVCAFAAMHSARGQKAPSTQARQQQPRDTVLPALTVMLAIPDSGLPDSTVKLVLSREPRGSAATTVDSVTFDSVRARIKAARSVALDVVVPSGLTRGSRPSIRVYEGTRSSAPFAFQILPPPTLGQRLSDNVGVIIFAVVILIAFASAYYQTIRERARKRAEQELQSQVQKLQFRLERAGARHSDGATLVDGKAPKVLTIPDALIEVCAAGRCVLFTGSGMAAQAGLPTYHEALTRIVERRMEAEGKERWAEVDRALGDGQTFAVADLLLGRLGREQMQTEVATEYSKTVSVPASLEAAAGIPFAHVLTTSFDSVQERAFANRRPVVVTMKDSERVSELLQGAAFGIIKLFCEVGGPTAPLLTLDDFRRGLADAQTFARFLRSLLDSRSILFAGIGLRTIQDMCAALGVEKRPDHSHYAFVPTQNDIALQQELFLTKFGVRLIAFPASPGYPELASFFETLCSGVREHRLTATGDTLQSATLTSVTLHNIGPFKDLYVTFDSGWNVVLGNNGAGKSSLLRAIALGLCGDDPKAAASAQRLLRVDQPEGRIDLMVGATRYTTKLIRESDGVRVISEGLTPLRSGSWAVLGFPPLRGVSMRNLRGPSNDGSRTPHIDDLLPVITGESDSRLDSIKQWAVNVDARTTVGKGIDEAAAGRNRQMLDSFFAMFDEFTPGVKVTFDHVDRSTWQVHVRTDDGVVPVEQLSQGMSSMFSWVGTLLQRMYEIYPNAEHPERQPALVLVDEIDAHLHPLWQYELAARVKKHFEKLQVVATTHSPLLVAGMDPKEIYIAQRDADDRKLVTLTRPPVDFSGMRADQILTSPLFGLASTRSERSHTKIDRYAFLLGKSPRNAEEENELVELRKELTSTLSSAETPLQRRVEQAVHAALSKATDPDELLKLAGQGIGPATAFEVKRQLAAVLPGLEGDDDSR